VFVIVPLDADVTLAYVNMLKICPDWLNLYALVMGRPRTPKNL